MKYHEACRKPARQSQYRIKSVKRQGVKKGNSISHQEVAERDGFICYLCQQPVDMNLPRNSRFGATLDHVTPISKGGADHLNNVRLAHWICNIRKSDKTLEEFRAESR
jgi:5-methylcytosine-specific restriction endonuclease McrA